jgi:hypothetical protein
MLRKLNYFDCQNYSKHVHEYTVWAKHKTPIPVAEQSKARVCGRKLAGISGPNPDEGMVASLL